MKILLLGCEGQVGWELQRSLAPLGEVVPLCRDAKRNPHGLCGDLTQAEGVAQSVAQVAPTVVVNAAAYTAVDKAESEPEIARQINALTPAVIAQAASKSGAWLLHYSTDYVFDGGGNTPWREDSPTGPLSVYGRTKLEGELEIARHCPKHLILRTSWVYAARGGNFAKTMLRLARTRPTLSVVDDQYGAPTGADWLADCSAHMLARVLSQPECNCAGTYHAAAAGCTTWFGYANHVLTLARKADSAPELLVSEVLPVPTASFPTPAKRPANSRLDTCKLRHIFGLHTPPWQVGVERMLKEIVHDPSR